MPTVIAVDAMGTDSAPKPEIEGALLAAREYGIKVALVGKPEVLEAELKRSSASARRSVEIVAASEVITMREKAAQAVRGKRDSSMHVGLRMVRGGKAAGFVSAGNTGAAMATAKMILGALPGVDRPALAAVFPTTEGTASIMLDVGANVDCKPHNLEQFALMGEVYFRLIFAKHKPSVGLLSIGEEESKGNELTRQAHTLLRELPIHFCGNVEGRDVYNGKVDVVVCDGFVGNVALKISEGLVEAVRYLLKDSLQATITRQVGFILARRAFEEFKKRLDYSEYGGAPLLGIKGAVIVAHGASNANAIKNAIRVTAEFAEREINAKIEHAIAASHPRRRPQAAAVEAARLSSS